MASSRKKSPPPLSTAALTREQLVQLLAAGGAKTTLEDIESDIKAGAPTNADGTFNLIDYAAWLASMAD